MYGRLLFLFYLLGWLYPFGRKSLFLETYLFPLLEEDFNGALHHFLLLLLLQSSLSLAQGVIGQKREAIINHLLNLLPHHSERAREVVRQELSQGHLHGLL